MTTPTRTLVTLLILSLLVGCGGESATATPQRTTIPPTTDAPVPTETPSPATPTHTSLPTSTPESTATPTDTPLPVVAPSTPVPGPNPCAGLSGELEMRVLAGPAEAVGLEPFGVGSIPFTVTASEPPYVVAGSGSIAYNDILAKEWGTYEVNMDLENAISGECVPDEASKDGGTLALELEMSGSQLVKVDAQGFQGEYPWSGTHSFSLTFPLEEGAAVEGEGWAIVLHLNRP
jgi:hypothetical protein